MQAANVNRAFNNSVCLLGLVCCFVGNAAWAQPDGKPTVTIGTVSGQFGQDGASRIAIFDQYLDDQIPDYHFQTIPFDTIDALTEAVGAGNLKFAFISPVAYVQLSQRDQLRPIATVTQKVNGQMYPWLASSVFVREGRPDLQTLQDVRHHNVTALSPLALGGWLAALREWRAIGISEKDFSATNFVFSHQDILDGVCNGEIEIGVLPASFFSQIRGSCTVPLRVLKLPGSREDARFPLDISTRIYPELPFAQIGAYDEGLVSRLMIALLSISPGSKEAKAINIDGFSAPLAYDSVADLMKELQISPFTTFGEITISSFVQQHRGTLALLVLLILAILVVAYVRHNRLQRKVRQSEQFRNQIFSRSQFAVIVLEARSQTVVDINDVAVSLLGFQKAEHIVGRDPLAASAPIQYDGRSASEGIRTILAQLEFDQKPLVVDWLMRRSNGELWDAEGHLVPFTYGNDRFVQVTLVDITDRKRIVKERERMEQQLQHAQRLESIGRFSGAIAHDFNNLLTVINGYSELLLLNAGPDDEHHSVYREISQACSRAGELTNQLLTFSRRRMAKMEALDVNRIIADSASMFRRLLGETVSMQTQLCQQDALTLADSGQLHQVLMNFVANARDAMPDGGEFRIATELCHLAEEAAAQLNLESGDFIKVTVSDNGTGMTTEVQGKIFEPFFTTKGERGTGFGLATAYGIIKQCKGGIMFQSELGAGTTFTVYLPVTTATLAVVAHKSPVEPVLGNGPRTVLLVEDEHDVRGFACLLLQSVGIKVIECESGRQALEFAQACPDRIDLLFTDMVLGDISGIKLAEQFHALRPGIPVLFTSGYANDEPSLRALMQERVAFIAKPYSPATLLASIKTLFEEQPVLAP